MSTDPNKVIYSMMRVSKFYNKKPVIKDISLSYFYGAKIGVLGLNGSGKSTLLKIMAGIDKEFNGETILSKGYTIDYLDPDKRSIANALTVELDGGKELKEVVCEYPIGHKRRRKEGMPVLEQKFRVNLARRFPAKQQQAILDVSLDQKRLETMPVHEYVDLYVI